MVLLHSTLPLVIGISRLLIQWLVCSMEPPALIRTFAHGEIHFHMDLHPPMIFSQIWVAHFKTGHDLAITMSVLFCASDCSPIVSCSAQYILICIFEPCKLIFISLLLTGESTRRFYFSWAWSQSTRYCWWSIYWWCFWGLRNWQFVFHNQWFLGDSHHFCWTMCIHVICLEDDVWI